MAALGVPCLKDIRPVLWATAEERLFQCNTLLCFSKPWRIEFGVTMTLLLELKFAFVQMLPVQSCDSVQLVALLLGISICIVAACIQASGVLTIHLWNGVQLLMHSSFVYSLI